MANIKIPPPPPSFKFPNKVQTQQQVEQLESVTENKKTYTKFENSQSDVKPTENYKKGLSEKGKKVLFFFLSALCFASSIVMFTLMFVL